LLLGQKAKKRFPRIALSWYGAFGPRFGATLGDLLAVENLSWALTRKGLDHAVISTFPTSLKVPIIEDYRRMPGMDVTVHVCGPIIPLPPLRFVALQAPRRAAVGVSVIPENASFNKTFNIIVVRDGQEPETFDLAPARFAGALFSPAANRGRRRPAVGLCLRGGQKEYGSREIFQDKARQLLDAATARHGGMTHSIDTVFRPENMSEKIIADFGRADIVATTRMHGALLGLCAGKPVIAIDQVEGGAKVRSVLSKIGWPLVFSAESVTQAEIDEAFAKALAPEIWPLVERCRAEAIRLSAEALATSVSAVATLAAQAPVRP
jgi:hypothetical protein